MKKIRIWIRMSININQHTKYQNFPTNEFPTDFSKTDICTLF